MSNETFNEKSRSDLEYEIDLVSYSYKTFLFGIYTRLNQFDRHFDSITTKYKNMALTWLLATYAGIGFLLSGEAPSLIINDLIAVVIICVIGLIGVSLIWHLDMNVYHRFWSALFTEELIMEEKYPFLLQSKKIMLLIDETREKMFSQSLLYLIANILLLITIGVSLFSIYKNDQLFEKAIAFISLSILLACFCFFMTKNSRQLQYNLHELIDQRKKQDKLRIKKSKK